MIIIFQNSSSFEKQKYAKEYLKNPNVVFYSLYHLSGSLAE